jgi:hypothetical protein
LAGNVGDDLDTLSLKGGKMSKPEQEYEIDVKMKPQNTRDVMIVSIITISEAEKESKKWFIENYPKPRNQFDYFIWLKEYYISSEAYLQALRVRGLIKEKP